MTTRITHKFSSLKADSGDATLVRPSAWDDVHDLESDASGFVLGHDDTPAGDLQELPLIYKSTTQRWQFNSTGSLLVPSGTSSQRPGIPLQGEIRWNSELLQLEIFGLGGVATWTAFGQLPPGTIIANGGTVIPGGYLECDGSRQVRATYPALYNAIRLHWDPLPDDGTTFALPNLIGVAVVGRDTAGAVFTPPLPIGSRTGAVSNLVPILTANMPAHTHPAPGSLPPGGDIVGGSGAYLASAMTNNGTSGSSGGNTPLTVSTVQPSAAATMLIKT